MGLDGGAICGGVVGEESRVLGGQLGWQGRDTDARA